MGSARTGRLVQGSLQGIAENCGEGAEVGLGLPGVLLGAGWARAWVLRLPAAGVSQAPRGGSLALPEEVGS